MGRKKSEIEKHIDSASDIEKLFLRDDERLEELNKIHAFINSVGGKPMVLCHVYNVVAERKIIEFRSPEAIEKQYCNQSVSVFTGERTVSIKLGKWWIENADRRNYDTIIFDPSKPQEYEGCLNLWEGFAVTPKKGLWKKACKHIWEVFCNKDRKKFKYVIKWFAWMIQNPGERAEVALVFKGKKGGGKGVILSQFLKIFGNHGFYVSNRDQLTGQFSGHLMKTCFMYADEAYWPGDVSDLGRLNALITEEKIDIRAMHREAVVEKNRLHIVMSTNAERVISASEDERRYFINEINNKYAKNEMNDYDRKKYFKQLWEELNNGGREAMLFDLLEINLDDWHPRDYVPVTLELNKQINLTLRKQHRAVLTLLEEGKFPGEYTLDRLYCATSKQLHSYFEEIEPGVQKIPTRLIGPILRDIGAYPRHITIGTSWEFPTLQEARFNWEKKYTKVEWNDQENWNIIKTDY